MVGLDSALLTQARDSWKKLWSALKSKDWTWKKGSGLTTIIYIKPSAKGTQKTELKEADYFTSESAVIIHLISSESGRKCLLGVDDDLDNATYRYEACGLNISPISDLLPTDLTTFMGTIGCRMPVEGRDNFAVDVPITEHSEGWEEGVATRCDGAVVVRYPGDTIRSDEEVFIDASDTIEGNGNFAAQWREGYFRSPVQNEKNAGRRNTTEDKTDDDGQAQQDAKAKADQAIEAEKKKQQEKEAELSRQAEEKKREEAKKTRLDVAACSHFPKSSRVVINKTSGAKISASLPDPGCEGFVAPDYDPHSHYNQGYVSVGFYVGAFNQELKFNQFPAADLSIISETTNATPVCDNWKAIIQGHEYLHYGRCERKYTAAAYFSKIPVEGYVHSLYAAMAETQKGETQFLKIGQHIAGEMVIAIERDGGGTTRLITVSPDDSLLDDPDLKWVTEWDAAAAAPATVESVKLAAGVADRTLRSRVSDGSLQQRRGGPKPQQSEVAALQAEKSHMLHMEGIRKANAILRQNQQKERVKAAEDKLAKEKERKSQAAKKSAETRRVKRAAAALAKREAKSQRTEKAAAVTERPTSPPAWETALAGALTTISASVSTQFGTLSATLEKQQHDMQIQQQETHSRIAKLAATVEEQQQKIVLREQNDMHMEHTRQFVKLHMMMNRPNVMQNPQLVSMVGEQGGGNFLAHLPAAPPAPPPPPPLPHGWQKVLTPDRTESYYCNMQTGQVQWERPVLPPPPPKQNQG